MGYWTDRDTVKKHLQQAEVSALQILNERVILSAFAYSQMSRINIDDASEIVKQIQLNAPYAEPLTVILNGTTMFNLTKNYLMWDSVCVSDSPALDTIYTENVDYVIDYPGGQIRRTSGGAIGDGGTVYVWYLYYTTFTKNSDYNIDYDLGQLRRSIGTDIEDGSPVRVDFSFSRGTVTDLIIDEAITEAEAWMVERLKDTYTTSSADQGLTSAATYFALVIICLSQSFKESQLGREDSDNLAKRWMELAAKYDHMGIQYFQKFSRGLSKNTGGLIQNRNRGPNYARQITSPSITARTRKR